MRRGMKKPCSLNVRRYAARLIDLNEYLASFLGATFPDNIGVTQLNEILLNSMPTSWSKHAYVQGFDCESITIKKAVNMFERMEIAEFIYEGVVEPSYKNLPGQTPTVLFKAVRIEERLPHDGLAPPRV